MKIETNVFFQNLMSYFHKQVLVINEHEIILV